MKEFAKGMSSRFLAVLLMLCILLGSVELPAMAANNVLEFWCTKCGKKTTARTAELTEVISSRTVQYNAQYHLNVKTYKVTCDQCKEQFTAEPIEDDSYVYNFKDAHKSSNGTWYVGETCAVCKYTFEHTHNYVETFDHDGGYGHDDTYHWTVTYYILKCSYEGDTQGSAYPKNGTKAKHSFNKDGVCTTCDYECPHSRLTPVPQRFDMDDEYHTPIYRNRCENCRAYVGIEYPSESEREKHTFGSDGRCTVCDYEQEICTHPLNKRDYTFSHYNYEKIDENKHWQYQVFRVKCTNCGYEFPEFYTDTDSSVQLSHKFTNNVCDQCKYDRSQNLSVSFIEMTPTTVQVGNKVTFTVETTGDIVEMIIKYYPLDENGNPDTANQKTIRKEYSANATIERSFSEKGDKVISFRARYSGSDEWSAESNKKTLTVTSKGALAKPVVTAPESVILGNSWNVSWTAVNHADYYRLQITDPNGPTRLLTKEFSGSEHSYTVPADAIKSPVRASVYVIATSNEGYDQAGSDLVYTTLYTCSHTNPDRTEASRALDQSKTTDSQHVYTVTYNVTCKDCGAALPSETKNETEAHTFNASGVCSVCGYQRINNLTVSVKADKTTAEVGKTIGATATPSGGDGSYNYSWIVKRDGVETYSTTTGYPEHFELVVDVVGQYVLVATVTDGSGKTATAQSEAISVAEKQPAIITSFTMKPTSVFVGAEVKFTVNTNADEIQMVIDGDQTYDSDIKQVSADGTISFTRTFSQAGERSISFHARYQGDANWGAVYDQPKTLTVNELSIPAFTLIDVKCASSGNNVGSVGDDVTVTWNPPVWQSDPNMKPDRYVIWISGPGVPYNEELKANYQAEREDDGSAKEHPFSGSKYTLKEGNYTIDVYAVIDDPEYTAKMASGNNSFTIAKPKLTITTDVTEKTVIVNGTTSDGVDNVKIFLTKKGIEEVEWTSELVEVRGNAFSLPLPSELFNNNQVYTVEAKGYKKGMDDVVVAQSNKLTASLKDGTIGRVSIHESGSSIAVPGTKIGELNKNETVETTAKKLKFYVYPQKGETLNAVTVQVDNGKIEKAAWLDDANCYLRTITLTPGTHTIKVRNKDGIGITGTVIVNDDVVGTWRFEEIEKAGRKFISISNDSVNALKKNGKVYEIGYREGNSYIFMTRKVLDATNGYSVSLGVIDDLHAKENTQYTIEIIDKNNRATVATYTYPENYNIIKAPTDGEQLYIWGENGFTVELYLDEKAVSYEIIIEIPNIKLKNPTRSETYEIAHYTYTYTELKKAEGKVNPGTVRLIFPNNSYKKLNTSIDYEAIVRVIVHY